MEDEAPLKSETKGVMNTSSAIRAHRDLERAHLLSRVTEVGDMLSTARAWIASIEPERTKRASLTHRAFVAIREGFHSLKKAKNEALSLRECPSYAEYLVAVMLIHDHLTAAAAFFGVWLALSTEADTRKKSGSVRTEETRKRAAERNRQIEALAADTSRTGSGLGALRAGAVGLAPDTLARKIRKVRRPT